SSCPRTSAPRFSSRASARSGTSRARPATAKMTDRRQFAPATERNREPILKALQAWLPKQGTVLEIASGSGEHAIYLAPRLKPLLWQPSNVDPVQIVSVTDWIAHSPADNLLSPLHLDATAPHWPVEASSYENRPVAAIFNANMIHISPWEVTLGLMAGDRKSTRLNSSHVKSSYAVCCL